MDLMTEGEVEARASQSMDSIVKSTELRRLIVEFAPLPVHQKWDRFNSFIEGLQSHEDEQTQNLVRHNLIKAGTVTKLVSLLSDCASSTHLAPIPDDILVSCDVAAFR